ncbi:MAG: ATP-binding protein [Prevotellaceae bacterium]|jgi:AAA+ ATPase superfamily predicted ATPase|nr:ATP-binding protein [Prevotellaceae bacterium]
MNRIIGRAKEISKLNSYVESDKAEFLVVYGRRRVGKTFLIKEFFKNRFAFYLSGAENSSKGAQLANFTNALNEQSKVPYPPVKTWRDAFVQLKHYLQNVKSKGRIVVFLDELPWLDNQKAGFLSAFEYFWNSYASSNHKIFLVVCGSSTSWLLNKIIKNRGGLHNRVTRQIFLEPFTLHETELFLKAKKITLSRYQIVECYMVMGGIPYYLDQLEKVSGLYQNIDNLFFSKNAVLRDEFDRLFLSLYKSPEKYIEYIKILAKKRKGIMREELLKELKIKDGGTITKILEELELCGFITKNNNFTTPKRNQLYQVTDFFAMFYLNFLHNKKITDESFWTNNLNTPAQNSWAGYTFELLCQAHLPQIKQKLGISGVSTFTASWRSKNNNESAGCQIDMLIDRNDGIINLCEMKFSTKQYVITKSYDAVLRNKKGSFIEEINPQKAIHTTFITTYGVKHNQYWGNIQSEITFEDLFK